MKDGDPSSSDLILVIDDEEDLCRLLVFNFREAGFRAESALTGAEGLKMAAALHPNIVVLDLMLPDVPGTEVCRRLRADPTSSEVAILMLTARGDEYDRVVGFELGADDYVVKPFSVREVVLRVRALGRRSSERRIASKRADTGKRLRWRELEVDPTRHRFFVSGEERLLRPLEFKLLLLLLEHPGRVFSRAELLEEVWGVAAEVNTRTVDTHVRRLRERLGEHQHAIETVHGFGYRLRDP